MEIVAKRKALEEVGFFPLFSLPFFSWRVAVIDPWDEWKEGGRRERERGKKSGKDGRRRAEVGKVGEGGGKRQALEEVGATHCQRIVACFSLLIPPPPQTFLFFLTHMHSFFSLNFVVENRLLPSQAARLWAQAPSSSGRQRPNCCAARIIKSTLYRRFSFL
jgi:hypothetical protein